jgi:sulfane dehydrogenase subunit SoxC
MEKALDDCLVAFKMNGEALRPEQGYPVRLVVPGWEGNMWVKWLRRLEVGDEPWAQREETSKYTDLLADGTSRRHTWEMDVKSVITSPSPQAPITHGRGRWSSPALPGPDAAGSSVSMFRSTAARTGRRHGLTAQAAQGAAPLLPRHQLGRLGAAAAVARDRRPPAMFSRPRTSCAVRGENSIYHNNGIQTWHVNNDGVVENVEVS